MLTDTRYFYGSTGLQDEHYQIIDKHLKTGLWQDGTSHSETHERETTISWIWNQELADHIGGIMQYGNSWMGWNFDIMMFEPFQYTWYKETNFFNWHIDQNDPWNEETRGNLPRDYIGLTRKLSISILLNDADEYEGGDFELRDVWHKPVPVPQLKKKGDFVVFPSIIMHRVTPITKGERKSLVGWACGEQFR